MSRFVTLSKLKQLDDAAREQAKDWARARLISARADLQMYADATAEGKAAAAREMAYDYTDEQLAAEMGELNGSEVVIPTSGSTLLLAKRLTVLAPASSLAALNLALPAGTPERRFRVASTRAITSLTYEPTLGDTVVGQAPSSLAAGGFFELYFANGATKTWVRIG